MELRTGTRRLCRDGVIAGPQVLTAPDVQLESPTPGRAHLVVEDPEPRVGRKILRHGVLLGDSRQDPDEDELRPQTRCAFVRMVQAVKDLPLVLLQSVPLDQARRDIDFQIELAKFGLVCRIREFCDNLPVAHRRTRLAVEQVDLDLQTGPRQVSVELDFDQHLGQHIEASVQLFPIPHAIIARKGGLRDGRGCDRRSPGVVAGRATDGQPRPRSRSSRSCRPGRRRSPEPGSR